MNFNKFVVVKTAQHFNNELFKTKELHKIQFNDINAIFQSTFHIFKEPMSGFQKVKFHFHFVFHFRK